MRDAWRFRNRTDKRHTPDVQKGRSKSHIAEDYAHRETVPMCNLGRPFCTSSNRTQEMAICTDPLLLCAIWDVPFAHLAIQDGPFVWEGSDVEVAFDGFPFSQRAGMVFGEEVRRKIVHVPVAGLDATQVSVLIQRGSLFPCRFDLLNRP